MRPVSRPLYKGRAVTEYKSYLPDLIIAYGNYCSYCERMDKTDVEHVVPKSRDASLELEWSNLLLGCPRCNRDFKKSKNLSRTGYVWPDEDNTYFLLYYHSDGRVEPAVGLSITLRKNVQNTIDLVCLDDSKQSQKPLCLGRRKAFKMANIIKRNYLSEVQTVEEVLDCAVTGYWSVWYTVFRDVPSVKEALEHLLPNTDVNKPE